MPGNPLDWTFHYVASFVVALVATLLIVRIFRDRWAGRLGLVDAPSPGDERDWPVAKVGGIAMCVAFSIVAVAATVLSPLPTMHPEEARALVPVLFGALAMCGVGLWDDLRELSPGRKLLLQVVIAAAVWYAGARFGSFRLPALGVVELSPFASLVFTVFWFVAITNAFNLVDGADGVAGGAALTATMAMFVVALVLEQPMAAQVLIVLAAALLGFLFFNFPPATVFMGDSGSLSIGFLLAGVGLVSSSKATTIAAIAIPVVSLGLPILDTSLAIVRRLLRGEGVHKRDLGHIHHRLQKLGHSPRQVALILYAACGALALASMVFLTPDLRAIGLVLLVLGVITLLAVQRLRIPELMELRRLMDRALKQREAIGRSVAIREAAAAVQAATGPGELGEALAAALEGTGVTSAEVRLNHGLAKAWVGRDLGVFVREEDELVWRWRDPSESDIGLAASAEEGYWEAHLPLEGKPGQVDLGTLRLRRHLRGGVPAELEIFTQTLLPEVARTVAAIEDSVPELSMVSRPALVQPKPGSSRITA